MVATDNNRYCLIRFKCIHKHDKYHTPSSRRIQDIYIYTIYNSMDNITGVLMSNISMLSYTKGNVLLVRLNVMLN